MLVRPFDEKRFLFLVLFLALLIRIVYIINLQEKWYFFDTIHYDAAAENILQGNGFGPSHHYYSQYKCYCLEPVYPLFLAAIYGVFGHKFWIVRIIQAIIGVGQIFLLYLLARDIMKRSVARALLLFAAVFPFFIFIAGLLYVTQFFAFCLTLGIWGLYKFYQKPKISWLLLGAVSLGVAIQARPVLLPSLPLFFLWLIWAPRLPLKRKVLFAGLFLGFILSMLTPWTIRNYLVFHKFAPGRACLAETRVFDQLNTLFKMEEVLEQKEFIGREFSVYEEQIDGQPVFSCALDHQTFMRLVPFKPVDIGKDENNFGLVFYDDMSNKVEQFVVGTWQTDERDTVISKTFDSQQQGDAYVANQTIRVNGGTYQVDGNGKGWSNSIVYKNDKRVNYFSITYPRPISPKQVRRIAMLIHLDRPTLNANGYMIWLHPWKEADLWKVKGGRPDRPIPVQKQYLSMPNISVIGFIAQKPVKFFFRHFVPEFLRFWSPTVYRIQLVSPHTLRMLNVVSILFFLPIVLLAPFGIYNLRRHLPFLLLLLIPIAIVSCGYSVFFSEIRYRIPIDGFMIILAFYGGAHLLEYFGEKRPRTEKSDF